MDATPEDHKHPMVTEHPEQRRREETGQENAREATEVGRPPSQAANPEKQEHAA